jgi:hypothetical protein
MSTAMDLVLTAIWWINMDDVFFGFTLVRLLLAKDIGGDLGLGDAMREAYSSLARKPICSSGVLTASLEVPVARISISVPCCY